MNLERRGLGCAGRPQEERHFDTLMSPRGIALFILRGSIKMQRAEARDST